VTANVIPLPARPAPAGGAPQQPFGHLAATRQISYTPAELAYQLRIPLATTYRLLRTGEIPGRKQNGRWTTGRRALLEWLKTCVVVTAEQAAANRRGDLGELSAEEVDLVWAYREHRHAIRPDHDRQ
jgi:hypothetical protein